MTHPAIAPRTAGSRGPATAPRGAAAGSRTARPVSAVTRGALAAAAVLALLDAGTPAPASAQMPDLRAMSGQPLPVPDLPPGTVVLRVVRQTPANAAAGLEVTATTRSAGGESRAQKSRTGGDGRVQFANLPTGSEFQASVTVDGETLETARFPVPAQGGVRVMLVAGLGGGGHQPQIEPSPGAAAPGAGAAGGGGPGMGGGQEAPQNFRMGATTGRVAVAADLPKGTLEIEVRNAAGQPLSGLPLRLGEVALTPDGTGRQVKVHPAVTDAKGTARFADLATGEASGYAVVTEHEGLRLSTEPFRMSGERGMRGVILALRRTRDPAVLTLEPRTKIIIDSREEALQVMVGLFFRNTSQEIFDPGEGGLLIPLPEGAVNAQEIEGGEPLVIDPGKYVRLKSVIPPDSAASYVTTARYGYILPTGGERELEVKHTLPVSLPDPFLLVPARTALTLTAPGIKSLPDDVDGSGEKVKAYTMSPIPAGGTLAITVGGLAARDRTGRNVAAALCILLVVAAVVASRPRGKRRQPGAGAPDREELVAKRERLFADLVTVEKERKASPAAEARLADRRKQLIAELEKVYRELADH